MAKEKNAESAKTESSQTDSTTATATLTPSPQQAKTPQLKIPSKAIYLGPSMVGDGVIFTSGTIFSNGIPQEWQLRALEEPAFARLLVPFEKVARAKIDLANPDSVMSGFYKKVRDAYIAEQVAKQAKKGN